MEELNVFFNQETVPLEGLYAASQGTVGAVISHPHPLMGGDMNNSVVEVLAQTLFASGISTLRFNFRGVGKSEGVYDEGRGEREDVLGAVSFMEMQKIQDIILVGYSFGAWVNAGVIPQRDLLSAIFVSPPIDLFTFNIPALRGKIDLIICGDHDQFSPSMQLKSIAAEFNCRLALIPNADHFWGGCEEALAAAVRAFLMRHR